jgi:hypothetical protein
MGRKIALAIKETATFYHDVHVKHPKLSAQQSAMRGEEKTNIATYSRICSVWTAHRVIMLYYEL